MIRKFGGDMAIGSPLFSIVRYGRHRVLCYVPQCKEGYKNAARLDLEPFIIHTNKSCRVMIPPKKGKKQNR